MAPQPTAASSSTAPVTPSARHPHPARPRHHPARSPGTLRHRRRRAAVPGHLGPARQRRHPQHRRLRPGLAETRAAALTKAQQASPLAGRPYDLRHGGVTLALNAGVPAPEVANRAGHSVEVLWRVYAGCIDGHEQLWNQRIEEALSDGQETGDEDPDDR